MNENWVVFTVAVFIGLFAVALHYTTSATACEGYDCFQSHMAACSRAIYINEDLEASWEYRVIGKSLEGCDIQVTLLQAKEGELNLRDLEKESMTCTYPIGITGYPDKDMSLCSGKLKESLQNIIIEKLHKYIINNLGDLKDALADSNNTG